MIWIYRILFLPAFAISFPYYFLRMLKRGGYARDFLHRFGFLPKLHPKPQSTKRIWIQAVSVGEINAIVPLLEHLKQKNDVEVVLTTTTSTGYAIAREKFSSHVTASGIFPLDFCLCNWLAWRRIQPDVIVLTEGELWPEHLHRAQHHRIPAILINARLSDRSFRRYTKFKKLAHPLFAALQKIGASSEADAQRFRELGIPAEKITTTGNLKFDVGSGDLMPADQKTALLQSLGLSSEKLGEQNLVLLGSSTWPGEEEMLLAVLAAARQKNIPLRLLLVPRHAERRGEIASLLNASKWQWFQRSKHSSAPFSSDICLADTTGELRDLTAVSDLAFIGKSLPPNDGGQTPIDCAAQGIPMVYGPNMSNFRAICQGLEAAEAAIRISSPEQAHEQLLFLLTNSQARLSLGDNALAWHTRNRGATLRTLALLPV